MLLLTARQGHHQIPRLKRRLLLLSLRLQNLDYLMKPKGLSVLISLLPSRLRHLHWWTNLEQVVFPHFMGRFFPLSPHLPVQHLFVDFIPPVYGSLQPLQLLAQEHRQLCYVAPQYRHHSIFLAHSQKVPFFRHPSSNLPHYQSEARAHLNLLSCDSAHRFILQAREVHRPANACQR